MRMSGHRAGDSRGAAAARPQVLAGDHERDAVAVGAEQQRHEAGKDFRTKTPSKKPDLKTARSYGTLVFSFQ